MGPVAAPAVPRQPSHGGRLEAAFAELLDALAAVSGQRCGTDQHRTPQRAAALWADHLLAGSRLDVADLLATSLQHSGQGPVVLRDVGVHLVCPHHLTVAWGTAHLAYLPAGRIAGTGRLCDLVRAITARFVLQEEAAQQICDALVDHLGAATAVASIEAVHPCHTVTRPHSHHASLLCWGQAGQARGQKRLQRLLMSAPRCR